MDTPPAANTRSRASRMATTPSSNGSLPPSANKSSTSTLPGTTSATQRNPPYLPTPTEALYLAVYPGLLIFGSLFSLLSPSVRNAPYDATSQAHYSQDPAVAPSYFARKSNAFNVLFVKRGWAWITLAFFAFLLTHPRVRDTQRRTRAIVRWALATGWWVLVTQWCFGPALIDRSFRYTGGRCDVVESKVEAGDAGAGDFVTAVACKAAGGAWRGGHDISGHVFLLVLGSFFLLQEVGWVYIRQRARRRDERSVVMQDGAVKSANVEAEREETGSELADRNAVGLGARIAAVVVVLCWWMITMTAIYFHTWFEKLTGLLVALTGIYAVYFVPRFIPIVRSFVGLPGI